MRLGTIVSTSVFPFYPMLFRIPIVVCGFACLSASIARETEPTSLSAIFAVPAKTGAVSPTFDARHSPVSDRAHRLIKNAVLAYNVHSVQPIVPLPAERALETFGSDAVLMDRVVVHSSPVLEFNLPKPISSLDRFRKHGIFYESVGKKFTFDAMLYVDRWYSNRQGSGGAETRAELKFNFRW